MENEEKKSFTVPTVEVVRVKRDDVIITSGTDGPPDIPPTPTPEPPPP